MNAIWWNIKINLQQLVDISGYELPTNLQNFTQKDLTKVKIFQKVLGATFWNTLYTFDENKLNSYGLDKSIFIWDKKAVKVGYD